jgi:hypothetical protein
MSLRIIAPIAALLASVVPPTASALGFSATASVYADDGEGRGVDVDGVLRPTDAWWIGAGLGRSDSTLPGSRFSGTSWRAAAGWDGRHVGVRATTRAWQDSDQLDSTVTSGELSYSFDAGVTLAAIFQDRALDIGYTVTNLLGRPVPVTASFDGRGYGAELLLSRNAWFVAVRGVTADYGDSLERVRAAALSPATRAFPRIQALVDSVATRSFAATDRDFSASVDRAFARSGLRLDLNRSRDALFGDWLNGASLSYRYTLSPRIELEASLGASEGDAYDLSTYAGLSVTIRN